MTDPLSYLRGVKAHVCGGDCPHRAGTSTDTKVAPESNSPPEPSGGSAGMGPDGGDQLCDDCSEPESAHTSPILKDGVVVGLAHPGNSCRRFVER